MKQVSITETSRPADFASAALATHTFSLTSGAYTASGATITIPPPSIKVRYDTNNSGRNALYDGIYVNPIVNGNSGDTESYGTGTPYALAYNTDRAMSTSTSGWSFNTSALFNTNNKTSRVVNINWRLAIEGSIIGISTGMLWDTGVRTIGYRQPYDAWGSWMIYSEGTVTLNAPPTFTAAASSSAPYYANVSTYRVNLTNLSAKYGGTISSAVLTVGNQTVSRTTNGELAVALNNTGTFTPTVKVTDSRGQATTVNLSAITVASHTSPTVTAETTSTGPYYTTGTSYIAVTSNPVTYDDVPVSSISLTIGSQTVSDTDVGQLTISPNTAGTFTPIVTITDAAGASSSVQLQPITVLQYSAPTINGSIIQRTETSGKPNEEDTSAVIGYQIAWVDALGHIKKPKIYIGSSTTEATVLWYKTYEPTSATETYLSNPITDWSTIVPGDVVYAFISDEFLIGDSYIINASVSDDYTTSAVLSMTLAQAFFTVDFLAGGHGIAFGQLATEEGFECDLDSIFHKGLSMTLDDRTTDTESDDYRLYHALLGLGWLEEGSGTDVSVKDLFAKILGTRLVVESGTSGIWRYRKWSDGTAECWGVYSATISHYATNFGGYGYYVDLTFPTGLFSSVYTVQYSAFIGGGFALTGTLTGAFDASHVRCFAIASTSGSQSSTWRAYVVGKWAELDPSSQTLNITGFTQKQLTKAEIKALIEASGNLYKDNDIWIPTDLE